VNRGNIYENREFSGVSRENHDENQGPRLVASALLRVVS